MDSGYYAACAGLVARTQALDLAASNLANLSTTGYKAQQAVFRSALQQANANGGIEAAVNDFGILSGTRVQNTAGPLEKTGNDFDLALEGAGFFAVRTAGGERYTRNGRFQLSAAGDLVTAQGEPVLGEGGGLRLPPGKLSVGPDGTLAIDGVLAGQLKLVDFPSGTSLEAAGAGYYQASAAPMKAKNARLLQGALEGSNVDPMAGAVQLIEIQRGAEMLQRAWNAFHSEFNRTAAQDLARV